MHSPHIENFIVLLPQVSTLQEKYPPVFKVAIDIRSLAS